MPPFTVQPIRVALQAEAVELEIVLARVGADFDERLEARHQVVAGAQRAAVAIVVAVVVAAGGAVGELRFLVFGAVGDALGGDLDAVEALRAARRCRRAWCRSGSASGPACTFGLPGIVGADDQAAFADQRCVARDVEPPGDLAVEGRPVELRRLVVGRVAAAQVAVTSWRGQSERAISSGETVTNDEAASAGVRAGLVS